MKEYLDGSCQCGQIRFRFAREKILTLYRCHCSECRKQSASAFGLSLKVRRVDIELEGELAQWRRLAPDGRTKVANFCGTCGCRVFNGASSREILSLKGGLVNQITSLRPIGNIWTSSAMDHVERAGELNYPRQPPNYDALFEAWRRSQESTEHSQ